jgi:ribA/ribD-fused uncharacterized protein
MNTIDSFDGEYRFLSNFWPCVVVYDGITYPSTEHYYVAMKTTDPSLRKQASLVSTSGQVKKFGRTLELRPDWDDVKLQVMEYALKQKFADPELRAKLIATGDAELIEGNWWGDVFWGVCKGKGENHLGRLLMKLRKEITSNSQ